jgi:hypothetical protein
MASTGIRWAMKLAYLEILRHLPDRIAVELDYFRVFGALPNLTSPSRFSEKIQHWKLTDHDPRMPNLVDKVLVKDYVAAKLGPQWVIPTLWHGNKITEAALRLAPKPAVVKANHSSAQMLFLNENSNFAEAARIANNWLVYDHHKVHREWAYGEVEREILIEPFIGATDGAAPDDYKFWVLDGAVRFIQVDFGRFSEHTRQFYTPAWKRLDVRMHYPAAKTRAPAPPHLDLMLDAARRLAEGFRFARVDLYDTPTGPLFGEMTFAPEAGLTRFEPKDFDLKLGESWSYPKAPDHESLQGLADAFKFTDK